MSRFICLLPPLAALAAAPQLSAQDTLAPPWHRVTRAYDLTPDSVLDTLTLEIWRNRASDSLRVVLSIRGFSKEIYRSSWTETYHGPEPFVVPTTPATWAAAMRDHLDHFFQDSNFMPPRRYKPPHNLVSGFNCSDPDPRGCIAWHAAYDAVLARWQHIGRATEPEPGEDPVQFYRAFYAEVEAEPIDTADVNATWNDILARTPAVFSMSYGYETTIRIAWSSRKQGFVSLFECC